MNSFEFNLGKVGKLAKNGMPLRKAWQHAYKKGSIAETPPASKIRKALSIDSQRRVAKVKEMLKQENRRALTHARTRPRKPRAPAQESTEGSVGRRILDNRRPPVSQPIRGTLGFSRGTFYKKPSVSDIMFARSPTRVFKSAKANYAVKVGRSHGRGANQKMGLKVLGKRKKYMKGYIPTGGTLRAGPRTLKQALQRNYAFAAKVRPPNKLLKQLGFPDKNAVARAAKRGKKPAYPSKDFFKPQAYTPAQREQARRAIRG